MRDHVRAVTLGVHLAWVIEICPKCRAMRALAPKQTSHMHGKLQHRRDVQILHAATLLRTSLRVGPRSLYIGGRPTRIRCGSGSFFAQRPPAPRPNSTPGVASGKSVALASHLLRKFLVMTERRASSRPWSTSSLLLSALLVGAVSLLAEGCSSEDPEFLRCNPGQTYCQGVCVTGTTCDVNSGSGTGGGGQLGSSGGAAGNSGGQSSGGGPSNMSGGAANQSSGGAPGSGGASAECTNVLPQDTDWPEGTCDDWASQTSECDAEWFADYCNESCGRCTPGPSGSGGGNNNEGTGGGGLGDDNPWGKVNGGQNGWASRYWDCCKQSCAWQGKGGNSPTSSCDPSGNNRVADNTASACDNGGSATTCNSYTPWAYSSQVSFGFVATHAGSGVTCGTCYHLEFTGSSHNGGADPGSAALAGKTMIVMSTNIGGDVSGDGQMDLLLPGGGTGALYGCNVAWGVQKGDPKLGATYGGLRSGCQGDLNGIKQCVKNKCDDLFGNLPEMHEGCLWYVDWFEAADNPSFRYEPIDCPSEISSVAK